MAHTYTNLLTHALFITYREEAIALLKRHGVEYDPRFVV